MGVKEGEEGGWGRLGRGGWLGAGWLVEVWALERHRTSH